MSDSSDQRENRLEHAVKGPSAKSHFTQYGVLKSIYNSIDVSGEAAETDWFSLPSPDPEFQNINDFLYSLTR